MAIFKVTPSFKNIPYIEEHLGEFIDGSLRNSHVFCCASTSYAWNPPPPNFGVKWKGQRLHTITLEEFILASLHASDVMRPAIASRHSQRVSCVIFSAGGVL